MTALARRLDAGFATHERTTRGSGLPPARSHSAAPPAALRRRIPAKINPVPEGKAGSTRAAIFAIVVTLVLTLGWLLPTERYITPQRGVGYWLGIVGGSMMLLLLLYPVRKRIRWLDRMGAVTSWFRFHVVFGIAGPLCILFHSNFGLGATNSNMALFTMLLVAGSGLVGRYLYAHANRELYGHGIMLDALRSGANRLRALPMSFLPELLSRLEESEQRLLRTGAALPGLGLTQPAVIWLRATAARWRLHRYIGAALRAAARNSAVVDGQRARLHKTTCAYVDKRLGLTRRIAGLRAYQRLLSLWHAIHVPFTFAMVAAGVVHVIAVHVY